MGRANYVGFEHSHRLVWPAPPPTSMENPPEHWDIAVLGTGLTESILAA